MASLIFYAMPVAFYPSITIENISLIDSSMKNTIQTWKPPTSVIQKFTYKESEDEYIQTSPPLKLSKEFQFDNFLTISMDISLHKYISSIQCLEILDDFTIRWLSDSNEKYSSINQKEINMKQLDFSKLFSQDEKELALLRVIRLNTYFHYTNRK